MIEADDLDRIFGRLDELEDREATVIRMRFGLDPFPPMTLREVGENLGLTRERVRQLENQALQKLMHGLSGALARLATERTAKDRGRWILHPAHWALSVKAPGVETPGAIFWLPTSVGHGEQNAVLARGDRPSTVVT